MEHGSTMVADGSNMVALIIQLAIMVFLIVAMWKVFSKAGQPGWACLIPFYNIIVLLKIAGKPGWWLVLFLVPLVNLVISIIMTLGVARNFAKGGGFAVGLILLPFIFYPILAFGDAKYAG